MPSQLVSWWVCLISAYKEEDLHKKRFYLKEVFHLKWATFMNLKEVIRNLSEISHREKHENMFPKNVNAAQSEGEQ